jgi:2-(1,2-epoxy-1,2-dihydrophenyl)acetyl-CoA isomerase
MLTIEDRGPVRWLTLDRPERLNAIPPDGWAALAESFDDFAAAEQRVLVVTGAGGAFCSGADISAADASSGLGSHVERYERMQNVATAASALHRLTKPTVAAVDGVAVGAGMNLALGCDLVIASSRARFAQIFVRRGLSVDFGGTWLLPRIVGLQRAKELALTGRMVEAAEAREIGMVLEVVEPDELESSVQKLAEELAGGAPLAQAFIKRGLDRSLGATFDEMLAHETQAQALNLGSEDVVEGVAAFLGGRAPIFRGR